jgi:hypothetical protein
MPILAESLDALVAVDTHVDTHTAVVLSPVGAVLAEVSVPTTPSGLAGLLAFAADHARGPRLAWVVEGSRSHGAGLCPGASCRDPARHRSASRVA